MDAFDCCTHISLNLLESGMLSGSSVFILYHYSISLYFYCLWWFISSLFLSLQVHTCLFCSPPCSISVDLLAWNVTSSDDLRCRSGNHTPCVVPPHAQSHLPWPRVHANNFSHTNPLPRRNTNRVMKQACTFLIKVSAQCAGLQFIEPNDAF